MNLQFKKVLQFGFAFCLYCSTAYSSEVMTWIPPYNIAESKRVLDTTFANIPVTDAISRVGLQFWNIDTSGNVFLRDDGYAVPPTDSIVQDLSLWGKSKNVKILMTIYNNGTDIYGYNSFDWRLVRKSAYGTAGDIFIQNILKEVDKFNLDGVDLDLEGEYLQGPYTQTDIDSYAIFVSKLSDSLKARSKILTIDTYETTNSQGAPNPNWFSSWKGKVDQIHTMGYNKTFWSGPGEIGYPGQQALATKNGLNASQLLIGMPMWLNNWKGGNTGEGIRNIDNLNYVLNCLDSATGVTLWDIHHPTSDSSSLIPQAHPWSQDSVWILLKAIKNNQKPNKNLCPQQNISNKWIDNLEFQGVNLRGGTWVANSDFWDRDTITRKANATKVYTNNQDYDLVAQNGVWADFTKGYVTLSDQSQVFQTVIRATTPTSVGVYGGIAMNFEPIDKTQNPSAQSYELDKIGVERDLSAYKKIVIGLRCDSAKTLRLRLKQKNGYWWNGIYQKNITCSGQFEDYELVFADLKSLHGVTPAGGFDAKHTLSLNIDYAPTTVPNYNRIALAGIALDTSVIQMRGEILKEVKTPMIVSTLPKFQKSDFSISEGEIYQVLNLKGELISTRFFHQKINLIGLKSGNYIIYTPKNQRNFQFKYIY